MPYCDISNLKKVRPTLSNKQTKKNKTFFCVYFFLFFTTNAKTHMMQKGFSDGTHTTKWLFVTISSIQNNPFLCCFKMHMYKIVTVHLASVDLKTFKRKQQFMSISNMFLKSLVKPLKSINWSGLIIVNLPEIQIFFPTVQNVSVGCSKRSKFWKKKKTQQKKPPKTTEKKNLHKNTIAQAYTWIYKSFAC